MDKRSESGAGGILKGIAVRLQVFLFFYGTIIFWELLLRAQSSSRFFSAGLLKILLLSIPMALLLCLPSFVAGKKIAEIVSGTLLSVFCLLYIAQMVYFKIFLTFFSLLSASRAGDVLEFWSIALDAVKNRMFFILLSVLPLIFYFGLIQRRTKKPLGHIYLSKRKKIIASAAAYAMLLLIIIPCARDDSSEYSAFWGQANITSSYEQIGLLASTQIDFLRMVLPPALPESLIVTHSPTPAPSQPQETPETSPSPSPADTPTPVPDWLGKQNVLDIDFARLAENETNKAIKQLHEYFSSVEPTNQNEYTGLYKGYNLIFITAEAFSTYAVNEKYTPTLYKMVNEGYRFTNFYNPSWPTSTSDGEYVACTSLIPKGTWSFSKSSKNDLPFCMGNQLSKLGYSAYAYHPHLYSYYDRDKTHPNMGYVYKGKGNGLEISDVWPESDLEAVVNSIDDYIGAEPFHAYYMTVSGHMNYSFTGNMQAYRHKAEVADLPFSEPARAYIACQIELDKAMEYLLGRLETEGVAGRTLIVLSADHYPYGLKTEELSELAGMPQDKFWDAQHSALIMYVPGMEPQTVDKPCSSLDILPTVSNLLGIPFDSRLLMGRDIFSDSDPLVIFQTRSFITDKGRYDAQTKKFTPNEDVDIPEDYRKSISKIIDARFSASAGILEHDYYRKLKSAD